MKDTTKQQTGKCREKDPDFNRSPELDNFTTNDEVKGTYIASIQSSLISNLNNSNTFSPTSEFLLFSVSKRPSLKIPSRPTTLV